MFRRLLFKILEIIKNSINIFDSSKLFHQLEFLFSKGLKFILCGNCCFQSQSSTEEPIPNLSEPLIHEKEKKNLYSFEANQLSQACIKG